MKIVSRPRRRPRSRNRQMAFVKHDANRIEDEEEDEYEDDDDIPAGCFYPAQYRHG